MDKNTGVKLFGSLQYFKHSGVIKVFALNVRSDFNADKSKFFHTAFKLFNSMFRRLHRKRSEPDKAFGIIIHNSCNVVIQVF